MISDDFGERQFYDRQFDEKYILLKYFGEAFLAKSSICRNISDEEQFDEYNFADKTIWR